jgi:hypothetical protein
LGPSCRPGVAAELQAVAARAPVFVSWRQQLKTTEKIAARLQGQAWLVAQLQPSKKTKKTADWASWARPVPQTSRSTGGAKRRSPSRGHEKTGRPFVDRRRQLKATEKSQARRASRDSSVSFNHRKKLKKLQTGRLGPSRSADVAFHRRGEAAESKPGP